MRLAVLQRRVRAIRQTRGAFREIQAELLVASLSADPMLTAQHVISSSPANAVRLQLRARWRSLVPQSE
jgi:hypothetical protein